MRVALISILLLTGWGMAQEAAEEPSLDELSRQAKAKKARGDKPARLITNADLAKYQNAPVSSSKPSKITPVLPVSEQTEEGAAEGQAAKPSERDLEFWRAAFREARVNMQNAVRRALVLQLRITNLNNAYLSEDDGAQQSFIQSQMQETLDAIEKNKAETEKARAAIDQLLQEARAAGLDPGTISEMAGEIPEPPPSIEVPVAAPESTTTPES